MNLVDTFDARINKLDLSLYDPIDSQTSARERLSLLTIQRCIRRHNPQYRYLEIGSHLGGSIQPYYVDSRCVSIYSIDKRPEAQPDERGGVYEYQDNSTQRMLDNLQEKYPPVNVSKVITFDQSSEEVDRDLIQPLPDICFIDGEHTNKAAFQDFTFCQAVSKPDAVIVFHDANFIFGALQKIEQLLDQKQTPYAGMVLGGSVYVLLLGQAIDWYSEELSRLAKDKEQYFRRSAKNLKKLRLQRRYPFLYKAYQTILPKAFKKKFNRGLVALGLRKKGVPKLQKEEGHLGGYVLGKAAPGTWCPEIWDWCIEELGVQSVLDVGCGLGFSLQYFEQKGIEVLGVDGSPSAIHDSVLPGKVHQHDYTKGPWAPDHSYDLVWSSEFLEHVEQQYEPHFFETFQKASKYLMVTFAVPGQGGYHHVNEQYAEYWIEQLEQIGFRYDEALTQGARRLLPPKGLRGMQFREKGLVFKKI